MQVPSASAAADQPAAYVNEVEIRQIGMSRSGNHALVNWILSQARGRTCFVNCTEPGRNPFSSARPLDDGRLAVASYPRFDLEKERRGELTHKDLVLFSHEDCFLGPVSRAASRAAQHELWLGRSRRQIDVLLLRDPFNLMASRLNGVSSHPASFTAFRIWKQHAREFLGLRRWLRPDRVLVSYNQWVRDPDYRRQVALALGLEFSDSGRLEVPGVAAGSSFDGRAFDGRAEQMRVLDRWRWLQRNPGHLAWFDHEVVDLAARIFGDVCEPSFYELIESMLRSPSGRMRN